MLASERDLRLPEPYFDLTATSVLTMEFVAGEKLDDALQALEDPEARNRLVARFVETFVRMFHERHVLHCDPHPGNFLLDPEGRIVLLDFGCVRDFKPETGDEVLRLLAAFWRDDIDTTMECYRRMGFGTPDGTLPPAEMVRAYHQLILEPIREHGEFDFGGWQVHQRIRRFLREHMDMVKLVPPAELLLYLRVLAGLKGLLTRMNARIDLRTLAEAQCVRRGVMP
jgi:predicted unusual protein kinase regulating ubiquinone biosynthesis (AarF/ABC1/UbiB family)